MKIAHFFIATSAAALLATSASATLLDFTVTGTDSASFHLDSDAAPSYIVGGSFPAAVYTGISGIFEGTNAILDLYFFNAAGGGGFQISLESDATKFISPYDDASTLVFTGTLDTPKFAPGTFLFNHDSGKGQVMDKLVISDPSAPVGPGSGSVPEPASWALMLGGFGLIGSTLRRRQVSDVSRKA